MTRARWTKRAADDLAEICDYTLKHFGAHRARRTALAIYEAMDSLRAVQESGVPDGAQILANW